MLNGNLAGLLGALKIPAAVVGGITGVVIIVSSLGFSITGPNARIEAFRIGHGVLHSTIDSSFIEINNHLNTQKLMLEGLVRSECIRETKQNLERSGLIPKCSELGIER